MGVLRLLGADPRHSHRLDVLTNTEKKAPLELHLYDCIHWCHVCASGLHLRLVEPLGGADGGGGDGSSGVGPDVGGCFHSLGHHKAW